MAKYSTNLDVRAYAALHNVTLGQVAVQMGLSHPEFSIMYMRVEQTEETKQMLKDAVDAVVRDRGKYDYQRVQGT